MKAQSLMEWFMTYGWAILIIIILAGALYVMGVFSPRAYYKDPAEEVNCTEMYYPAKVWYVEMVDSPTHVQHGKDDLAFLSNLRNDDVWVYCYTSNGWFDDSPICGSFNNIGVFHWMLADCME